MRERRYGWQTFVGAGLLLILTITVFFPVFKLGTEYENIFAESTGNIPKTGLFFARWIIKVGVDGRDCAVFKWWGILIYFPVLISFIVMIYEIVTGKVYEICLIVTGAITFICEIFLYFLIPSVVWKTFDYDETFQETIKQIVKHGDSTLRFVFCIIVAFMLIIYGILALIVFKSKKIVDDSGVTDIFINSLGIWNDGPKNQYRQYGQIMGIKGQYKGQIINIASGEEIVFGRDPRLCMLIFDNLKISRKHCAVRYDAEQGCYRVIDYSANGTKLSSGQMLFASTYTLVQPGADIYMNKGEEIFRLL